MGDLQSLLFLGKFEEVNKIIQEYDNTSPAYKLTRYYILLFEMAYNEVEQLLQEDSIDQYDNLADKMAYFFVKGDIGLKMRRLDEGINYIRQGLELYNRSDAISPTKLWYARLLTSEGTYHGYLASFSQSSQRFQEALQIFMEFGDIMGVLRCHANLCASAYWLGDLNDSLNYGLQALGVYEKYETRIAYEVITNNVGLVYHSQNQPDLAINYFLLAEQVYRQSKNQVLLAVIYFNIIQSALLKEDITLARKYLNKYTGLDEEHPMIILVSKISQALTLGKSQRMKDKVEALSVLEGIAKEPVIDYQFTIYARYAHIDLLMEDFTAFGSQEIISEIEVIINELMNTAEQQQLLLVRVNTGLLKSRLLLIRGEFNEAKELLETTLRKAKEKGMKTLSEILKQQLVKLEDEIQYWEDTNRKQTPLPEVIRNSGFKKLVKQVTSNRLHDILEDKSKPLFLIILQPSGIPIYANRFDDFSNNEYNEFLISSLLTALEMFGKEALSRDVHIDQLHFSDNVILSKKSGELTYAYAYNGGTGKPLIQLTEFIEKVENSEIIASLNHQLSLGLPIMKDLSHDERKIIDEMVLSNFQT
ncbi:MAG: tetratricopeptide repeat protein [Candidatus Kariarchaeaceae archaeon]|jgi:tetratricopeptide (TPR) repeat protein